VPGPLRLPRRRPPDATGRWSAAPWHGPPPSLPALADRAAERWFALPPRLRLAAAAVAAVAVLLLAGAGAARSPWGPPVDVLVARTPLTAGAALDAGTVSRVTWPAGLVPHDAVVPGDEAGRSLAVTVVAGTVITGRHLVDDAGVGGGLGPGRAAFPLEAGPMPPLRDGQRVDVVAADVDGRGRVLARDARVVARTSDTLWLDVAREEAAGLAAAAVRGGLRLVVLPP
jgi:hypothetical protein